jgi:protein arginine kinase
MSSSASKKLRAFLAPVAEVARRSGPKDRIVMSSRVRLARNLVDFPFPGWAKKPERIQSCEKLRQAVEALPEMNDGFAAGIEAFSALDKQVLVERHLISREHAAKGEGSALVLSADQVLSVMINEEDHLRMQCVLPGLQLDRAWEAIDAVDTALESRLQYAFSPQLGYLTACPTNVGTGIRVSAMLHLPALVLAEQINQVIQAVNKLGLAVRGLYGEGTEALGNVFQVSNQMTLGDSEEEIVERLNKVVAQIIEHETDARALLLEKQPRSVYNHIGRAYGILANAHSVPSKEAINLLSLLRLGIDLALFGDTPKSLTDELFLLVQPAHLQLTAKEKLNAQQRDHHRADLIRERLRDVPRPGPAATDSAA